MGEVIADTPAGSPIGGPATAAAADALANPTISQVGADIMGFNGTTWDRLRNDGGVASGKALAVAIQTGGGTRVADVVLVNAGGASSLNGTNSLSVAAQPLLATSLAGIVLIGQKEGSSANLGAVSSYGAALATPPGQWPLTAIPAVNTVATATRASAGAGFRNIITGIQASFRTSALLAAAITVLVVVRDGASGAGTIIWQQELSLQNAVAAGGIDRLSVTGLNIVGSVATALTVEFTAAGGANTFEIVNAQGYITQS